MSRLTLSPLLAFALALCCLQPAGWAQPAGQGVIPMGSGAGVHGADSPIPPLPARPDTLAWELLTAVKLKETRQGLRPAFEPRHLALDQKLQKVQGFMMPLEPGERQKHFLLTSVPTTCAFCTPGGPESMVEIKTKVPVKYTLEAVVIEGRFAVLPEDPYGLFYRMTEAVQTK